MNFLLILLLFILGCGFVGLVIWLVLLLVGREKIPKDTPIILNLMAQYSNGRAIGREISTDKINGREFITYTPGDIHSSELEETNKVETVSVVSDKAHTIPLIMGGLSKGCDIKIILPPNPEDLSDGIKDSILGPYFAKAIGDINAKNTVVDALRSHIDVEDKLLNKTTGGNRTNEYIELDSGLNKKMAQKVLEKEKLSDNKTNPYNRPEYGK